jgi:DNA primase
MVDVDGRAIGVRLRRDGGFKFAIPRSREGLFLPRTLARSQDRLLVSEGVTDAAALLDIGFENVVGRPSCCGAKRLLVSLARRLLPMEIDIVADNDKAGRSGADDLAAVMVAYAPVVRVASPPDGIKDVRAWRRAGGDRRQVQACIESAPLRRLTVHSTSR